MQVIGLLRWPILVPGFAADAASANAAVAANARDSFTTASDILGTALGETLGYLLTATWTLLAIVALGRRYAGRWFRVLGEASAVLVLAGDPLAARAARDRHRELPRVRPVERVADRARGADARPRAADGRGDVVTTWQRSALRWLPTFIGFPLGGVAAELVAGPVDGLGAALLGGAVTGAVLGSVQSWGMGSNGPPAPQWIAATTVGLTAGLALGSAAVGYGTGLGDLAVQGAICGLAIGIPQARVLRRRVGYVWAPALSALWALGWAITTSIGVDVETQYAVFGSSGALVVTAATAALPVLLARSAS